MSTYAFRDAAGDLVLNASEFGRPIPAHAQSLGALKAVEAVRAAGAEKRLKVIDALLVTDHGREPVEPYDRDPIPTAARSLLKLAAANGFTAHVIALTDRCTVEGYASSVAFRAYWIRGRTNGGTWHERDYRYAIVNDTRAVKVDANKRTGLKGYRSAGMGTTRLALLATPHGMPCNITEIEKRIREHGN